MIVVVFIEAGIILGLAILVAGDKLNTIVTQRSLNRSPLGRSLSYENYEQAARRHA